MSGNTQYGTAALNSNNGDNNTAIGAFNSYNNTSGEQNTSVGSNALLKNTSGSDNTAIGSGSMCFNTVGSLNTAIGSSALQGSTAGSVGNYNIALGASALYKNTGNANVAVGTNSLEKMTLGSYNVAIGDDSGIKCTTYNYNTLLGAYTDISNNGIKFSTSIGYGAVATESNTIMMGGPDLSNAYPTVVVPGNLKLQNLSFIDSLQVLGIDENGNVHTTNGGGGGGNVFDTITVNQTSTLKGKVSIGYDGLPDTPNILDVIGNVQINVGDGGAFSLQNIPNISGNQILYYNTVDGTISYGPKTNEDPIVRGSGLDITGDGAISGKLSVGEKITVGEGLTLGLVLGSTYSINSSSDIIVNGVTVGNGPGLSSRNTVLGVDALKLNSGEDGYNVAVGWNAGNTQFIYNYNTLLGALTDTSSSDVQYSTAIGYGAVADTSNTIKLGGPNLDGVYPTVVVPGSLQLSGFVPPSGSPTYYLGVDANGNVITANGGGGGYNNEFTNIYVSTKGAFGYDSSVNVPDDGYTVDVFGNISTTADCKINGVTVGRGPGTNNTNTVVGNLALFQNSSGQFNVAFGQVSLSSNTEGQNNCAFGQSSLSDNITGNNNIGIGLNSGSYNISGNDNTYLGYNSACAQGVVVNYSTAVGSNAVVDTSNTIVLGGPCADLGGAYPTVIIPGGSLQLKGLTSPSGSPNYYLGVDADGNVITANGGGGGYNNQFDKINVSIKGSFGYASIDDVPVDGNTIDVLGNIVTSADCTINGVTVGQGASQNVTNTVVGNLAFINNLSGIGNSTFGQYSLSNNIAGALNCAFGQYSLIDNTTGSNNVGVGILSGLGNSTGYCNTFLGNNTYSTIQDINNSTAIGSNAIVNASNTIVLGGKVDDIYPTVIIPQLIDGGFDPSAAPVGVDSYGNLIKIQSILNPNINTNNLTANGDSSLIGNVGVGQPASVSSSNAMDVSGNVAVVGTLGATQVTFTSDYRIKEDAQDLADYFIIDNLRPVTYKNKITQKQDIGLIAHEVQKEIPILVNGEKDAKDLQTINYIAVIPILIKEIKDLKNRIKVLEGKE